MTADPMPAAPTREQRSAHTPPPWRIFSWPTNNPDDGKVWCYGMHIKKDQHTFAEHEANALMMSTAPAGLALAYAVAEHFEGTDAPLGKMARDFIRKATGES